MIEPNPVATWPPSGAPLVRVVGIAKSFGGVRALRGVNLEVFAGEVHALLGENGAGKSTLIKILSGVHAHDEGFIEISGKRAAFDSPAQARDAGTAVVYQDLSLVESLSVGANLMLGREPRTRWGFLRKRQLMAEAGDFLKMHDIPLDPRALVSSLSFAYRQMTEICKALMGDVRILILDEPTSALTGDEEKILFDAIRTVTDRGVGVIYVTHRLNEVFRISQRVTVFRDGVNAGLFATAQTNMKQLVAAIVGPSHSLAKVDATAPAGEPARRPLCRAKQRLRLATRSSPCPVFPTTGFTMSISRFSKGRSTAWQAWSVAAAPKSCKRFSGSGPWTPATSLSTASR
jgi:ribose transport system ATP-binding protein